MYARMELASPRRYNDLPGAPRGEGPEYETAAEYRAYLEDYARREAVPLEPGVEVTRIERRGEKFQIHTTREDVAARIVIVATGSFDEPHVPPVAGTPTLRVLHSREWPGLEAFEGQRVLVVGGATSALEIAQALLGRAEVRLSVRRTPRPWPQKLLGRDIHDWVTPLERFPVWTAPWFCRGRPTLPGTDFGFRRALADGRLALRPVIAAVDGRQVRFVDGSAEAFDALIWATGYRPSWSILPPDHPRRPNGVPLARNGKSPRFPGLFFLGARCGRGPDSEYLRGIARDAPAIARAIARRIA